jgi:putative DNA primase/helicase
LNGLESAAVQVNDGFLCLDEMSKADAQDVSKSLYLLANGVGKQRATVNGKAMQHQHWRVSILSNGEDSIESHLNKAGIPVKAGELVRFLQLQVFGQHGAFDHLHDYGSGRAFASALHQHTAEQYGTAGIAFLERLTRD